MNRKVIPRPTTDKVDKKLTPGIRIAIVEKIKQQLIIKRKSINPAMVRSQIKADFRFLCI